VETGVITDEVAPKSKPLTPELRSLLRSMVFTDRKMSVLTLPLLGLRESTRLPRFKTPMRMKSPGVTVGTGKNLKSGRWLKPGRILVVASVASAVNVGTTLAPAQPRSNIAKIVMRCKVWLTGFWLPA
jgi:hypothetical protein